MQYKLFSTHTHWLPLAPKCPVFISKETEDGSMPSMFRQLERQGVLADSIVIPDSMGAIGGEITFMKFLKLDTIDLNKLLKDESLSEKLSVWKFIKDELQKKSHQSLADQVARMELEATGVIVTEKKDYRDFILKSLINTSTNSVGYIIWLNHKQNDPNFPSIWQLSPSALNPLTIQPNIMENLNKKTKTDDDEDEENNIEKENITDRNRTMMAYATRNISVASGKRALTGAKQIAKTARQVLKHLEIGTYNLLEEDKGFSFQDQAITIQEVNFYRSRNTPAKVLELCIKEFENAEKWDLLPLPIWTVDELAMLEERVQSSEENIQKTIQMCDTVLVRKGYDIPDGVEILARPKNTETIMKEINKTKRNDKMKLKECCVLECKIKLNIIVCTKCKPSKPYCKQFHHKHDNHKDQTIKDKYSISKYYIFLLNNLTLIIFLFCFVLIFR